MISLAASAFRQELAKRLASIERLCKQRGVPMTKQTLILRDPDNDNMSLVLTNEDSLEQAWRIVCYLEGNGGHATPL